MENKKSTKRRVIAITVLASLLIALLAFNVTYAYFTDRIDGSASLTFGTVNIEESSTTPIGIASGTTGVLPGQTVRMQGVITNKSSTPIWVKLGAKTSSIKLKVGNTEIVGGTETVQGTKNPNWNNHVYSATEVTGMQETVTTAITEGIQSIIETAAGESSPWNIDTDGITKIPVPINTSLDLGANSASMTLTGSKFGNLFQGVTIEFTIEILAVQTEGNDASATNLTRTQAAAAFSNAEFNSGKFTA